MLILPPTTLSPIFLVTGRLSPVSIDSSTELVPFITSPSTEIFSPGLTTTISPILTSSIFTSTSTLFLITLAVFGCNPINFFIADEVCPFVRASKNFPNKINVTIIPADS